MKETYVVKIITTCLRNGLCDEQQFSFDDGNEVPKFLRDYLENCSTGLYKKFLSAQRRFYKGTVKGIKVFYSEVAGLRYYLWITVRRKLDSFYLVDDYRLKKEL